MLEGKTAIVTGASKGIGAEIARSFAENGASVVLNYATDARRAEDNASMIVKNGGQALCVQGDVSVEDDARRIVQETVDRFGRIDVLVNNAATWKFGPFEEVALSEMQRMFNVNVIGAILMIREALPHMSAGSSIINIGSIESRHASPGMLAYASTKGAIDAITDGLSRELGGRQIRVNTLAPGVTFTEGLADCGYVEGSAIAQHVVDITPLGRGAVPRDIANVATFLASDLAAFVTGERILTAGGAI